MAFNSQVESHSSHFCKSKSRVYSSGLQSTHFCGAVYTFGFSRHPKWDYNSYFASYQQYKSCLSSTELYFHMLILYIWLWTEWFVTNYYPSVYDRRTAIYYLHLVCGSDIHLPVSLFLISSGNERQSGKWQLLRLGDSATYNRRDGVEGAPINPRIHLPWHVHPVSPCHSQTSWV